MVHNKDDLQIDEETENVTLASSSSFIDPVWAIDDDGIPACTQQTDYDKIIKSQLKKRAPYEFERLLHCFHCAHYLADQCYFSKGSIDQIELDRNSLYIRCELCGAKIDRMFSILMSYYYKDKFSVKMPIICCTCYSGLEHGTFERNTKRRLALYTISLITSFYFLFTYFFSVFNFSWFGILILILSSSFWISILTRDIKNIIYLYKGRKYYQELMHAEKYQPESAPRDAFLDDEDKKKPPEGSYHSPGYDY